MTKRRSYSAELKRELETAHLKSLDSLQETILRMRAVCDRMETERQRTVSPLNPQPLSSEEINARLKAWRESLARHYGVPAPHTKP